LYLSRTNRGLISNDFINWYNHPLGRPPKEGNDKSAEDKRRAISERDEIEGTFCTSKRIYKVDNTRAKLSETADTWI
jgi:transposase, IS5 family